MTHITLLGKDFPLEYTVQVMDEVTKKYGGTAEAASAVLNDTDPADQLHNIVFMLSAMMKGAERRERVRCALWGEEYKGTPALDYETLLEIMNIEDLHNMADVIVEVVAGASKPTVDLVQDPKKNEATQ
ncbi:MAG: hypothetical protein IJF82_20870 [Achromobacter sp.]|nr:hypothetical protein [Achromobacter sp.]